MSPRNVFGMLIASAVVGIFGLYVHRGGELTTAAGLCFGGGLLFAGMLIDEADFLALFRAWRGKGES